MSKKLAMLLALLFGMGLIAPSAMAECDPPVDGDDDDWDTYADCLNQEQQDEVNEGEQQGEDQQENGEGADSGSVPNMVAGAAMIVTAPVAGAGTFALLMSNPVTAPLALPVALDVTATLGAMGVVLYMDGLPDEPEPEPESEPEPEPEPEAEPPVMGPPRDPPPPEDPPGDPDGG